MAAQATAAGDGVEWRVAPKSAAATLAAADNYGSISAARPSRIRAADPAASAAFAQRHLGFSEDMSADGFVSLSRPDAGFNLVFLRTGLATFKPETMRSRSADGLLVAFVVDDVDAERARLEQEGVAITTPLETEAWGGRYFQVTDPNGVVIQFVQWVAAPS